MSILQIIGLEQRVARTLRGAGIAVTAVTIDQENDRATWRVHPSALQAAAQSYIDAFVPPTRTEEVREEGRLRMADPRFIAILDALYAAISSPRFTRDEVLARAKQRYEQIIMSETF